jgi:hypothetical protein
VLHRYLRFVVDPDRSVAVVVTAPAKAAVRAQPCVHGCICACLGVHVCVCVSAFALVCFGGVRTLAADGARGGGAQAVAMGYRNLGYAVTSHASVDAFTTTTVGV